MQPTIMRRGGFAGVPFLVAALAMLASAEPAAAHENHDGDQSIVVVVDDERVVVTAAVAFDQLGYTDSNDNGALDSEELTAQQEDLAATVVERTRQHASLSVDGAPLEIVGAGVPALSDDGSGRYVTLVFATAPHDGDVGDLELQWDFNGPSTDVVLTNADGAVTGELGDDGTATFSLNTWSSIRSFFDLGVEHIQYGLDHLLFLLVLTLAAVGTTISRTTTWRAVKLVTAFTIGHAISLALAYYEIISVPASIVEPAISLSIVVAAVLAIRGGATESRIWLAGLIGLIHGLGFASNLSSLGVAASQRVAALAAFNVGVDIAQTVVVLIVIAGLWALNHVLADRMAWLRVAGATGAALVALTWTASRLAELSV